MSGVPVLFRGGPLGGELRWMEKPPMRLRVPSIMRLNFAEPPPGMAATVMHDIEEYELAPGRGGGDHVYEYLWINPASYLRERVKRLTTELEQARKGCERERQRADDLVEDAANWRSLKGLVDALEAV